MADPAWTTRVTGISPFDNPGKLGLTFQRLCRVRFRDLRFSRYVTARKCHIGKRRETGFPVAVPKVGALVVARTSDAAGR